MFILKPELWPGYKVIKISRQYDFEIIATVLENLETSKIAEYES